MVTLYVGVFMCDGLVDHIGVYSTRARAREEVNRWIMANLEDYRDEYNVDWSDEEIIYQFIGDSSVADSDVYETNLVI